MEKDLKEGLEGQVKDIQEEIAEPLKVLHKRKSWLLLHFQKFGL